MINPASLFECLRSQGVEFFAGVPDSLLKSFCAYVDDHSKDKKHVIAANEGNAIALAAGYHMATESVPAVYMQNSGLGNTINPLTSLADKEVYGFPMLLVIGWRGEPGVKDEPQHIKQGRITPSQLEGMEVPYEILNADSDFESITKRLLDQALSTSAPVALLVRKNAFESYKTKQSIQSASSMSREDALNEILSLADDASIISTTGKTSREVFELRVKRNEPQRDFLTVGGMGHTSSIALGVALGNPDKPVVCIDGDGSVLMHMGALPIIGDLKPANFLHVLLNNAAHESVGGQPTVAGNIEFESIAKSCGYIGFATATTAEALKKAWAELSEIEGPTLIEVKIKVGSRDDLGRPTSTPKENKNAFMKHAKRG